MATGYELAKCLEGTLWECSFDTIYLLHIFDVLEI
jgi:hypothetical protein